MTRLLDHLRADFNVFVLSQESLLHKPVEEWPHCDVLVAFFSNGYPLAKVHDYVRLRQPFLINDLEAQVNHQQMTVTSHLL